MFESVFAGTAVTPARLFLMLGASLAAGLVFSFLVCFRTRSSKSFFAAAALLPMTVGMVIALVNGNLGIGVAIAGAFGLVRFRSAQGTAREITVIFIGMASGLAFGMGYLAYGILFLLLCGTLLFVGGFLPIAERPQKSGEKILRITIPEALDYTAVFEGILTAYTAKYELEQVKSTNMGSMFRLTYRVRLRDLSKEKEMLDALRVRNGNLEISCERADLYVGEL